MGETRKMGNKGLITGGLVFSGRFDPPHIGHIETIMSLADRYDKIEVVILDYPDRKYPVCYVSTILENAAKRFTRNIIISVNNTHFGKIQLCQWQQFHAKYYASGNLKVLRHMEKLIGHKQCVYEPRTYEYEAHLYPPP